MRETKRLQSSYCLNPITLGCQLLLAKPYSCHILTLQTNLPTSYCAIFRHETVHLFLIYEPCTCKRSEPLQQFLLLAKEVGNCRQFNRSIWVWFGSIFSFMSCLTTGAYQKVSPLAAAVRVSTVWCCITLSWFHNCNRLPLRYGGRPPEHNMKDMFYCKSWWQKNNDSEDRIKIVSIHLDDLFITCYRPILLMAFLLAAS